VSRAAQDFGYLMSQVHDPIGLAMFNGHGHLLLQFPQVRVGAVVGGGPMRRRTIGMVSPFQHLPNAFDLLRQRFDHRVFRPQTLRHLLAIRGKLVQLPFPLGPQAGFLVSRSWTFGLDFVDLPFHLFAPFPQRSLHAFGLFGLAGFHQFNNALFQGAGFTVQLIVQSIDFIAPHRGGQSRS
jgi:hypothetical protein